MFLRFIFPFLQVEATPQGWASHLPTVCVCVCACVRVPHRLLFQGGKQNFQPERLPLFRKPLEPGFFHNRVYLAHPRLRSATVASGPSRPEPCGCWKGREASATLGRSLVAGRRVGSLQARPSPRAGVRATRRTTGGGSRGSPRATSAATQGRALEVLHALPRGKAP